MKNRRILALLLFVLSIFSLVSCENKNNDSNLNENSNPSNSIENQPSQTPSEIPSVEPSVVPSVEPSVVPSEILPPVIEEGKVLNIRCWSDEFQTRFRSYYPDYDRTDSDGNDYLKDGTKVVWSIIANDNNGYQKALDMDLKGQANASLDNRIDMFLFEADYALKYVDSAYTLDIREDIGLTNEDMDQQYQYTHDIATDSNGILKGVTWQATPGVFAYRRSIAKEVLGTDDPTEVQAKLSDWAKFEEVAADMKESGYYMLSGYDDAYRTFFDNANVPYVNASNEVEIPNALWDWVDQTENFTNNGYNKKTKIWWPDWTEQQGPNGQTFGFFYSTWGVNFTLEGNSLEDAMAPKEVGNGIYGDWAVCEGPASYYWGGTWVAAANGTDNPKLIKDIMYYLTCDATIAKNITLETLDYTNCKSAMNEIANDETYGSALLSGQNPYSIFHASAQKIDMSNCTKYDFEIYQNFYNAFLNYLEGSIDKNTALKNFKTSMNKAYPELNLDKVILKEETE